MTEYRELNFLINGGPFGVKDGLEVEVELAEPTSYEPSTGIGDWTLSEAGRDTMSASQLWVYDALTQRGASVFQTLIGALQAHVAQFDVPYEEEEDDEDEEDPRIAELFDDPAEFEDDDEEEGFEEDTPFESTFGIQRVLIREDGEYLFVGHAEWEEEHGFAARMRGENVLEVGYADLGRRR